MGRHLLYNYTVFLKRNASSIYTVPAHVQSCSNWLREGKDMVWTVIEIFLILLIWNIFIVKKGLKYCASDRHTKTAIFIMPLPNNHQKIIFFKGLHQTHP